MSDVEGRENDIAIVGMALRFPGARSAAEFWANLAQGVESVRALSDAELVAAGVAAEELSHPRYVKAGIVLDELDGFDAEFFGFSPKEAAIMDPQHRQFLECAWEALESAGHVPESFGGTIGVFGGCGMGAYFALNLLTNKDLVESVGLFLLRHTGNDKDFLTTRVSYCLNLRGPSVNVQTACSTSLVATHLACQSLLSGECDIALAGGVTIEIPHGRGYVYQPGEILSPDGHCRAFDHRSEGTIFGSGAGIIVLRRLADALRDGDVIHAVIKGSAVNNDGAGKVGYLAPSVDGQAAAISEALAVAGVSAESIGYVECHGTGTKMGDPIEIAALTQAFRQSTAKTGFCAVGSVKTNIGHLDTAAGVASLIKASLALSNRQLPPSLHFETPNPEIDFAKSPFFVSQKLAPWPAVSGPRRAGVNSLGVGGTNAYVVLEEAPARSASSPSVRPYHLITLSARTKDALDAAAARLADHLSEHPDESLADVAFTLQQGRRAFSQRRVLAAQGGAEASELLRSSDARRVFTHDAGARTGSVAFMFPGGGAQYPRMGHGLYETEPVFRQWIDRGFELAKAHVGRDLFSLVFPSDDALASTRPMLERPSLQLPAIFIVEHALAQLWMSWGIRPSALVGHSMGENTAACIAGVFRFEDCLGLVALRGRLMDEIETGGMLSVALSAADLEPLLGADLDLASVNAPELSVASGPRTALEVLERELAARQVDAKWIPIHIAAHSRMLEPILPRYVDFLKGLTLSEPKIPIVSNLSGTWMTPEQAVDPLYWGTHLRKTVLFADGVRALLEDPGRALLEVGPGKTLSSLARQHPAAKGRAVFSSLRHADEEVADAAFCLTVLGRLWATGLSMDFAAIRGEGSRRRVSLPTYPFQHQRYFIEPGKSEVARPAALGPRKLPLDDWFYRPTWKEVDAPPTSTERLTWLLFIDEIGIGDRLAEELRRDGQEVITVRPSDAYYQLSHHDYRLSPEHGRDGYDALVRDLVASGKLPDRIAHLWLLAERQEFRPGSSFLHRNQERGFYSLLFLAQAVGEQSAGRALHITAVSSGMQRVGSEALQFPDQATVLGPCKVIPREMAGVTCSSVDIALTQRKRFGRGKPQALGDTARALLAELKGPPGNRVVALRGGKRFEQTFERITLDDDAARPITVREGATYVITGGLGGLGMTIARHLASVAKVNLVLVARSVPRDRSKLASVHELEAKGASVLIVAADVTDPEKMRQGLDQARRRFGKIHGVVHAAGVLSDDLLQTKTQNAVENVFAPKVYGTLVLDSLFAGERLDFFVLFSSTSVAIGPAGQVDYVAANAFLNAFAERRNGGRGGPTIALGWGVWNEVGMAAKLGQSLGGSVGAIERTDEGASTLLMGPRTSWILDEHRTIDGRAVVPGTAYIDMARAALTGLGETLPFEVCDLFFLRALAVADDRQKEVRIGLRPNERGYDFEVTSRDPDGASGWDLHAQAKLVLGTLGEAAPINLAAIAERCCSRTDKDEHGIASRQERHLRFGRRWRVLREASYGKGEALGTLELPAEFGDDLGDHQLHPALLDIATGFAMDLIEGYDGETLWVPVSYGAIRVRAPLPARLRSWVTVRARKPSDDFASFDVVLSDEQGAVLVEIEELTLRKLVGQSDFGATSSPLRVQPRPANDTAPRRSPSPAETAFFRQLEHGILPAEGCAAFDRVLARWSEPVIVASSMDLGWLIAQADAAVTARGAEPSVKFARPELATSYVAPHDDIERTLVGYWQELLGVEQVGVEDNFFDLGGHSLVAVRLFAKIKTTYRVDYPISILFEAPTVARCAALIRAAVGEVAARPADSLDQHRTRFTHLVPMHPAGSQLAGQGGGRTPFFLVAGMFGNVLNLRHLAHLIGQQRPFYGLQARGLYGDHTPHETFEAMAADYIAELCTVQPHGPYLLGGFSGGGITAYEMARQLKAAGEAVSLLVLLDTPLPKSPELTTRDRWMLHVDRLRRRGAGHLVDWIKERYAWETGAPAHRSPQQGEAKRPFDFHSEAIEAAFRSALHRYELVKMPVQVALFRPKLDEHAVLGPGRVINRERRFIYADNGWGPYVGAVEVFEMPGDHDSMVLEPNVRVLAARLRACIEKAETASAEEATRMSSSVPPGAADDAIVA
jgi:acyl transferase domain-containing protein/thioesterase domain-containing protein